MQIATEQRAPWHKIWRLSKPGSGVHQQASGGISSYTCPCCRSSDYKQSKNIVTLMQCQLHNDGDIDAMSIA